jgi:hypothetical protein
MVENESGKSGWQIWGPDSWKQEEIFLKLGIPEPGKMMFFKQAV